VSWLWAAGGLLAAAFGGILALGDLRASPAAFLALYGTAFVAYASALWLVRRAQGGPRSAAALVAAGAIFRATLLPALPALSDDVYRYVWDGRVQAAGVNPFLHPPASPELAALRDRKIHPRINHPEVSTIYPPAAQIVFLASRGPLDGVLGMKLVVVLFDLGTALVLWRWLRRRGRPLWVLAHAWNPLCVVEFAHSGHMDAIPIFFFVLALERADAGHGVRAAVALGLSAGAKLFALALLPFFARRWRPAWVVAPAVVAALYLPYAGAGARLFEGLGTWAGSWRFNASGFALLEASVRASLGERAENLPGLVRSRGHAEHVAARLGGEPYSLGRVLDAVLADPGAVLREVRYGDDRLGADALSHLCAQVVAGLLLALWILWLWTRAPPIEEASLAALGGVLVLGAAVQPWYVTWLVPVAATRLAPAALAWSGTAVLAYSVLLRPPGAPWEVPVPWRVAEYGLPLLCLAMAVWRRRAAARAV
jgi:hypothetical protein